MTGQDKPDPKTFIPEANLAEMADRNSWVHDGSVYKSQEYREFFTALGEAIAAWSLVESSLEAIFHRVLNAQEGDSASAVYNGAEGSRQKLTMTTNALKFSKRIKPNTLVEWDALRKEVDSRLSSRNDLAHHVAYYNHGEPEGRRLFLARKGITSAVRGDGRKCTAEILTIRDNFNKVAGKLLEFLRPL